MRTKGKNRITWTRESPATPELIDDYFYNLHNINGVDEDTDLVALDLASKFCKEYIMVMKAASQGQLIPTMGDISVKSADYLSGFNDGVRYIINRLGSDLYRR